MTESKSRIIVTGLAMSSLAAVIGVTSAPVSAKPPFLEEWRDLYPASQTADNLDNGGASSCQVCHAGPFGDEPWNDYGWTVRQEFFANGEDIVAAILSVEDLNPDMDPTGCSSIAEINSDTQPGWTEGPNNTFHFEDRSTLENQEPPADALGDLDPSAPCCPGDLDGDGTVGITDFLALLSDWGNCPDPPQECPADLDNDNEVGITDFLGLLANWGPCL